jgi:hypothetical protein
VIFQCDSIGDVVSVPLSRDTTALGQLYRWMGCAEFAPGTWLPHNMFFTTMSFCLAC